MNPVLIAAGSLLIGIGILKKSEKKVDKDAETVPNITEPAPETKPEITEIENESDIDNNSD